MDDMKCSKCGSKNVQPVKSYRVPGYCCRDCGHLSFQKPDDNQGGVEK